MDLLYYEGPSIALLWRNRDVSLESVKECQFLRDFPKARGKQSSVLSPSADKMEKTLKWASMG